MRLFNSLFRSLSFRKLALGILCSAVILALALTAAPSVSQAASHPVTADTTADTAAAHAALLATVTQKGSVRVVVGVAASFSTTASVATVKAQQPAIQQARQRVLSSLSSYQVTANRTDWVIPAMALTVDKGALQALFNSPDVTSVVEDHQLKIADATNDTVMGVQNVWNAGYSGVGQAVAILDSGVQRDHPFFTGRVVGEACFSTTSGSNGTITICPNGQSSQQGAGAAAPCANVCSHGTHVAGIAAGNGYFAGGPNTAGVAINANIIAVQVFSGTTSDGTYAGITDITAFDSDIISGLNFVYNNNASYHVAAVNMSLGNSTIRTATFCDSTNPTLKNTIDLLRGIGVATVIAAGNDSDPLTIEYPGCISSAVSVGASDNLDGIAYFSDANPNLSLLAPGYQVLSSVPGSSYDYKNGTSMATPQVTGAFAVLKSRLPNDSVDQILGVLRNTGKLITDTRSGNPSTYVTTPRVQLDQAFKTFVPRQKTIGAYYPSQGVFYLRNTNTTGNADITITFGAVNTAYPIVGDWNGGGIDTIGVYNQANATFSLRYSNTPGPADSEFVLGYPGDQPIAGRWNARSTVEGVGVFRPSNGLLYLKNVASTGFADYTMVLGIPGDVGIAEDWNGDGSQSAGVYRPSSAQFFGSNIVANASVVGDFGFTFGYPYELPIVGDWNGVGHVGVGVFNPTNGYIFLRDDLNSGYANNQFTYGVPGMIPVAGRWTAASPAPESRSPINLIVPGAPAAPSTVKPPATLTVPLGNPSSSSSYDG